MEPTTAKKSVLDTLEAMTNLYSEIQVTAEAIIFSAAARYEVPRADLRTEAGILRWTRHLGDKSWITIPLLMGFVSIAAHLAGISLEISSERINE